ncbi:MAG: T9SS type A sorting domain-containing protein [Saprospiraceae bacterium]|nr:T9SS type A sorting domain-containing protein [Saprospiraceae bacterium]
MKKIYATSLIAFILVLQLNAQDEVFDQPSVGPSYTFNSFYSIVDGEQAQVDHSEWDIAFDVAPQGTGIFVNEGAILSFGAPAPQVELYLTGSTDFETLDTAGMQRIYNEELNWEEGAFNHVKDPSETSDVGWGLTNQTTAEVNSIRFYVIRLREGQYKKLEIQSMINEIYTIRYANLDGSDEQTHTINKVDYSGKTLAYFSLAENTAKDLEPEQWDLAFTRYYTPLDDGQGGSIQYQVTGTLSNSGMEIAQADGVDPATVNYLDYEDSYTNNIKEIGFDWKFFDFQSGWGIVNDRAYFVKTRTNEIWKLIFYDFEGSSTGVSTLGKTFQAEVTDLENAPEYVVSLNTFPNPTTDILNISFELEQAVKNTPIRLYNQLGQLVWQEEMDLTAGFQVRTINIENLPTATYQLLIQLDGAIVNKAIIKK